MGESNIKGPRYISRGVDEHVPLLLYDKWSQTDYYNGDPEMDQIKFDNLVDRRRLERIDLEEDEEMKRILKLKHDKDLEDLMDQNRRVKPHGLEILSQMTTAELLNILDGRNEDDEIQDHRKREKINDQRKKEETKSDVSMKSSQNQTEIENKIPRLTSPQVDRGLEDLFGTPTMGKPICLDTDSEDETKSTQEISTKSRSFQTNDPIAESLQTTPRKSPSPSTEKTQQKQTDEDMKREMIRKQIHKGLNPRDCSEYMNAVAGKIMTNKKGIEVEHVNEFYKHIINEKDTELKVTKTGKPIIDDVYKNIFCEAVKERKGYGVDDDIIRLYNKDDIEKLNETQPPRQAHHRYRSFRSKYVGLDGTRQNIVFTQRKNKTKLTEATSTTFGDLRWLMHRKSTDQDIKLVEDDDAITVNENTDNIQSPSDNE